MAEEFKEDTDTSLKYFGSWKRQYNSMYHGSSVMRTSQLGDSMVVSFEGSAVKFMGAEGWNHGTILITLDGDESTVDGYCCGTGGGSPQVIQFEASGLTAGSSHILNITNLASGPYGAVVEVDAIIVTPHPYSPSWATLALFNVLLYLAIILLRSAFKSDTYAFAPLPMHPRSFSSVRLARLEEGCLSPSSEAELGIINLKENPPAYTHTPESSSEELETTEASGSGPPHTEDVFVDQIAAQRLATIVVHPPPTELDAPPQYRDEITSSTHLAV